ncbi:MAG: GAF domain-containing protein [Cyanobacteria bacterium P01_D01_bin.156]
MDNQTLLKDALTDELGSVYKNVTQLTYLKSLPDNDLQLLRGLVSVLQFAAQQMSQEQASGGKLTADVMALQEQVSQLQQENKAYHHQLQWVRDQIALSRTAAGKTRIKASLKQTLDTAVKITQAGSGSLFLLDPANVVTECILTRGGTTERERHTLVGKVLEQGLAGWVLEHHKIETISDTALDKRWISLPNQPYKVRSALCAPLISSDRILGLITLTHPEPKHFQPPMPDLIEVMAEQMALVLENIKFQTTNQNLDQRLQGHQTFCHQLLATDVVGAVMIQGNKFIEVNDHAARIFGEEPNTLLKWPSIRGAIAYEDLNRVRTYLEQCTSQPGQATTIEFGINHKSGQVKTVTAQGINPIFQGKNAVLLVLNLKS